MSIIPKISDIGSCYFYANSCNTFLKSQAHAVDKRDCSSLSTDRELGIVDLPSKDGEVTLAHGAIVFAVYSDSICVYRYMCLDEDKKDCLDCGDCSDDMDCPDAFMPSLYRIFCFPTPRNFTSGKGNRLEYDCETNSVSFHTEIISSDSTVTINYDNDTYTYDLSVTHEKDASSCTVTLNDGTVIPYIESIYAPNNSRLRIEKRGCSYEIISPCDRTVVDDNLCQVCVDGVALSRCYFPLVCNGSGECVDVCSSKDFDELNCERCENGVVLSKCSPSQFCDGQGNCLNDCSGSVQGFDKECIVPEGEMEEVARFTVRIQTMVGVRYEVILNGESTILNGDGTVQTATWQAETGTEVGLVYRIICTPSGSGSGNIS